MMCVSIALQNSEIGAKRAFLHILSAIRSIGPAGAGRSILIIMDVPL
jgi:hypothetical protein